MPRSLAAFAGLAPIAVALVMSVIVRPDESGARLVTVTEAASTSVPASTSTTTFFAHVCLPGGPRFVTVHTPVALTVTGENNDTTYDAPVGTTLIIRLAHGTTCFGPYWAQPHFGPSSVVTGHGVTIGAVADGTFDVVGVGDASIRFPGVCGPIISGCIPADFFVFVHARGAPTTTTVVLPRTT